MNDVIMNVRTNRQKLDIWKQTAAKQGMTLSDMVRQLLDEQSLKANVRR